MERVLTRSSFGGIGVVLIAALCISLSNVLAPLVYRAGSNAYTLLVLRYLAFLILCGAWIIWFQKGDHQPSKHERLTCYGAGLAYAVGAGALLASFAYLPVSLAILIFFTFPFITFMVESILARRLPHPLLLGCLAVAFIGLIIALRVDTNQLSVVGICLAALGAVGVACSYVWTGRALKDMELTVMTLHMSLAGFVFATAFAVATNNFTVGTLTINSSLILGAAVVAFGAAFLSMFLGVRLIGATQTAMLMNLEPVFTICLAFLILRETLSTAQLLGATLVISSVAIAQVAIGRR